MSDPGNPYLANELPGAQETLINVNGETSFKNLIKHLNVFLMISASRVGVQRGELI